MSRRQLAGLIVGLISSLTLFCTFSSSLARPQESVKDRPAIVEKTERQQRNARPSPSPVPKEREAQISKMLDEYDLKPHPPLPIPDDPPPHEGAMIGFDHIVEPPDLVLVEVLEALPGRPISGERIVRPDGKIDIGFYGEVYVRGLTLEQVKVAIIKHLRRFLNDEALGLEMVDVDAEFGAQARENPRNPELPPRGDRNPFAPDEDAKGKVNPQPNPELPKQRNPFEEVDGAKDNVKPRPSSEPIRSNRRLIKPRPVSGRLTGSGIPVRPITARSAQLDVNDQEPPAPTQNQIKIPLGGQGKVTITIEHVEQGGIEGPAAEVAGVDHGLRMVLVPPAKSATVFADITAYNSKNYFILGDVQRNGRMPWTGNETVLDALQYAGGMLSSAEPKDIRLVRPARGGKPARVYKVDLDAIQNKGDAMTNYQIFPNDRLIVGRNEVVKKTVEIDRLNAPIQSITGSMLQEAFMLRALQFATADNREELLKEFVDFWTKELSRPGGLKFDEQTLREALMRKMKLTPTPLTTTPAPR